MYLSFYVDIWYIHIFVYIHLDLEIFDVFQVYRSCNFYCIHIFLMVTCFAMHFEIDSPNGGLGKVDPKTGAPRWSAVPPGNHR